MSRDTLRGVFAGGATFVASMILVAGAAVGVGAIDGGPVPDLHAWLRLETFAGALASAAAGYVARRVAGSWRAAAVLAAGVLVLGLAETVVVLEAVSSGVVTVPVPLVALAPLVAALGTLLGGVRFSDFEWPMREASRGVGVGREAAGVAGYAIAGCVLLLAAIFARFALPELPAGPRSTVVASALTLDMTVTVPALVYWLLVRRRRLPWIALVPAFVAGYAVAAVTIPAAHHQLLDALRYVVIPAELLLVSWLGVRARRALTSAGEGDFATRFRAVARETLEHRVPADVLTTEVAVLYHAFRPVGRSPDQESEFTVHREVGYAGVVIGLGMAVVVEAVALHALLGQWSSTVAWILSGLSVYALVWLIGDYRALAARPIRLDRTRLALRVGLRWEAEIPLRSIVAIGGPPAVSETPSASTLVASVLGRPNLRLWLAEPIEVTGMYGLRRHADEIQLRVDRVAGLREALTARIPTVAAPE